MVEFNLLKPIIRKFIPQVREYCASGKLDEVIREFKTVVAARHDRKQCDALITSEADSREYVSFVIIGDDLKIEILEQMPLSLFVATMVEKFNEMQ